MPIEMPRGLPFSVDTWSPSSKRKRHHFLTHAHKDHCSGILTHSSYPIYSTHLTKSLVLHHYPQLEDSLFVGIEVGQSMVIDDPDGQFWVTALDANHCPEKYINKKGREPRCQLDYVFLDCTFGRFHQKLPGKHSATQQVINCIWKHPAATVVYLTCDLLGQEDILADVSQTFGSKIYVDKTANPECFQALTHTVPQILTEDPSSRFHVFDGFPKLSERAAAKLAEAQANFQPEPLIIRPSAQWYACEEGDSGTESQRKLRFNEAVRDSFGVWHVCYSMHSSREELEWALQLLVPKWVVSTTPNCRAMELDYVRKCSFGTRLTSNDDPIWKLLDISVETSSRADTSAKGLGYSLVVQGPTQISEEYQLQPEKPSSSHLLSLSPPSNRPPLTLFGRARLSFQDSNSPLKDKIVFINDLSPQVTTKKIGQGVQVEESEVKCRNKLQRKLDICIAEEKCENSVKNEAHKVAPYSPIGSSSNFSHNLRKYYRSMNVPVPQPLPSLVKLMDSKRKNKRRIES